MRKTMQHTIRALMTVAAFAAAFSCQKEDTPEPAVEYSEVTVSVLEAEEETAVTKSSLNLSESSVKRISVGIYDALEGVLVQSASATGSSVTLSGLVKGRSYRAYALTNTSVSFGGYATESTLQPMTLDIGAYSNLTSSGIPMASDGYVTFTCGSVSTVAIPVERLAAKYSFRVDRSLLDEGTVTVNSVRLRQAATRVYPYEASGERWASSVGNGDSASSSDISSLNSGGSVTFYAMENCHGNLLAGNTDPWSKVPSNISSRKDYCTYLEMSCSYTSPSRESDNVTYRMYLGGNATTNFDIERNTTYTLTFRPTDEGLDHSSWKIDPGDVTTWTTGSELVITPSSASIKVGGTKQYTATYYMYTYANGELVDTESTDVTSLASWTSSRTSVATVSRGKVTGTGAGTATVTATYGGESGTATVSVSDDITYQYELKVTPASASIKVGGTQAFTATYYTYTYTNGTKTNTASRNVTSSATWSSSSTSVATVSSGTATGRAAGSSTITATYSGKSASASLTVSDDVTYGYELKVTPSSSSVNVGSTTGFTATYYTYTYTNGTLTNTSSSTVTSSASWSSSRTSVATVSRGTVTGVSSGTATITASYSGESATATVTVLDVITSSFDIKISPTSATINVGNSRAFTATLYSYTYTNGTLTDTETTDVTGSSSWSSSSTAVATVSAGTATGRSAGTTTIKATYNGKSASATLTVQDMITYSYELKVTPASATVYVGGTKAFTATYYTYTFTNGSLTNTSSSNVTSSASWSSSSTTTATVSSGTATGKKAGTATITATYSGKSASATLTVQDLVETRYRITLSPAETTITEGQTVTYTVRRYADTYTNGVRTSVDSTGTTIANSNCNWSITSGTGVATVNSSGVATAASIGTATVKAVLKADTSVYATAVIYVDFSINIDPGTGGSGSGNNNF